MLLRENDMLAKEGLLGSISKVSLSTCKHCLIEKKAWKPFDKALKVELPSQLVYSDLCRPMNVRTSHEAFYFIIFIGNFMR